MSAKKRFLTAFSSLFLVIPLLSGLSLSLLLGIGGQAPATNFEEMFSTLPSALRAGVYPEADEIPDGNLPQGKIETDFLPAIINILLALVSTVLLGALLVSGTFFIIHFGDEEKLKIAKGILKWAIVGIIIIVVAYAIVQGVVNLDFSNR